MLCTVESVHFAICIVATFLSCNGTVSRWRAATASTREKVIYRTGSKSNNEATC